ncbi:GPI mannosyltransferase 4 [Cephus cinctus]|uniref:Mannosyltransferase n=1 Tax=Cephus cinctus TaxID=211228 RepID=A0AAJ7BJ75_CEPCN|nr:GPI mannosyltransferase 4 [Cephus cinctus]XP_015587420.1 GPI mannosyltransferase 4 [Cephus cinctus]
MGYKNEYHRSIDEYNLATPIQLKMVCYWVLAGLRIVLTFLPQIGYIHPDEYFQSIEVIAGDYFDIDVYKPWEYNASFPVRTAVFPYLIVGTSYSILSRLSPYSIYLFGTPLKSPYFLILFPRLLMCGFSFVSDYCLYRICNLYNQNYRVRLVTYASSYIMITYATRTFSNSIELVLTSLLLHFVSECMAYSEKIVFQSDHLFERYRRASSDVERVKYYKLLASLPQHSLNHCLILATITVAGIFNRPTFIAFAFPPIFFWLQRGLGSKTVGLLDFHIRIFTFILYGIPTAIFFILFDSFYFGYLTLAEIHNLDIGMKNFVVTPLNFLKYNSETKNLASHGLHPRFLHFLVNVPLLYNVLGIIGLITFGKMIYSGLKARWLELPRIQSIIGLMTTSFILPILILSIFPHQEPRFIIPVTLPLVFLYAEKICDNPSTKTVAYVNYKARKQSQQRKNSKIRKLVATWYICNTLLAFFYGFAHQGGVFPLATHIAAELKAKPHLTHIHVFTSYTYSFPTALIQLRNTKRTYITKDKYKYRLTKDFFLYEQGARDIDDIYEDIAKKLQECEKQFMVKKIPYRFYYALPVTLFDDFMEYAFKNNSRLIHYRVIRTFYPHVTVEWLPFLDTIKHCIFYGKSEVCIQQLFEKPAENVFKLLRQFGLLLLRIEYPTKETNQNIIL